MSRSKKNWDFLVDEDGNYRSILGQGQKGLPGLKGLIGQKGEPGEKAERASPESKVIRAKAAALDLKAIKVT